MQQLLERVAGLDVHRKTIAVCVRVPAEGTERTQHVRTFGTAAPDLLALRDWLEAHQVTQVAMESTGVYWKPVFYVLEESLTCLLVNAAHVQKGPGRMRPDLCLPALSFWPGHKPAQLAKCWAVGNWRMSTPISAMRTSAVRWATPGMLSRRCCSAAKGRRACSMRVLRDAIASSR